jgi:hypothetical protein
MATTAADGTFSITEVAPDAVVVAQLGDRRSLAYAPSDVLAMELRPTSHVEGKVQMTDLIPERVFVQVVADAQPHNLRYGVSAPVSADGSFTIDGAPRGKVRLYVRVSGGVTGGASAGIETTISSPSVKGITIEAPNEARKVHVVVRSAISMPLPNAQVVIEPGTFSTTNAKGLTEKIGALSSWLARPIIGEAAPAEVRAVARTGDLFATLTNVPPGSATACGVALPPDLNTPGLQAQIDNNLEKIEVRCVPIKPDDKVVIVEIPPWPRLDSP